MRQKDISIVGLLKTPKTSSAQKGLSSRIPIAVVDVGSNSVRLVIYDGLTRSPSILFNEKVSCGLGIGVAKTGSLDPQAAQRALNAIKRFSQLAKQLNVKATHVLATAATRSADNGKQFIKKIEKICDVKVETVPGEREADLAGFGIKGSFYKPEGIAADLGGGSMELVQVNGKVEQGITTSLGVLQLMNDAKGNLAKAIKIVNTTLKANPPTWPGKQRTFYAIGGTWRSLARFHMYKTRYPLHIVHEYTVSAKKFMAFCDKVLLMDLDKEDGAHVISNSRRHLIKYGAIVLKACLLQTGAKQVSISSAGLRDGFMYSLLDKKVQTQDALTEAAAEYAFLHSRSAKHCHELATWTKEAFRQLDWDESENMKRYRQASCYLSDIHWRSSAGYRAEQTFGIINNSGFNAISHAGVAYLSIVNFHRHQGLGSKKKPPTIAKLANKSLSKHARVLAAFFRLVYQFTAGAEGVLPQIEFKKTKSGALKLVLPKDYAVLVGERPRNRIEQLERELGDEITLEIAS